MIYDSAVLEKRALETAAAQAAAAVRTAPKAKGTDELVTLVVTEKDKDALAAQMLLDGEETGVRIFTRDAGNVQKAGAVLLVGTRNRVRGVNCGYCGYETCALCVSNGGICGMCLIDLGIAAGSAVSVAADSRIDSRIMYTVGVSARKMGLLGDAAVILGIPLSVSGKSPFFDRPAV